MPSLWRILSTLCAFWWLQISVASSHIQSFWWNSAIISEKLCHLISSVSKVLRIQGLKNALVLTQSRILLAKKHVFQLGTFLSRQLSSAETVGLATCIFNVVLFELNINQSTGRQGRQTKTSAPSNCSFNIYLESSV